MAEFCEVMKQRKRMCEKLDTKCSEKSCPLSFEINGKNLACARYVADYPQEAEKIIMDWAKEHPVMTNADKFKEVFGIEIGNEFAQCDLFECKYYGFWGKEYVEQKKEQSRS